MGRLEITCRRFAVLSGVQQDPADYAVCVHPNAPGLQRKGTLALIAEPSGDHPALGSEACTLAQQVVVESYFADQSLSLTSSLLNSLESANSALLEYNYSQAPDRQGGTGSPGSGVAVQTGGMRTRRAKVGMTAVLIRPDGEGMYLSQMAPTQAYVLHNGLLTGVPEPGAWKQAAQRTVVTVRKVGGPDEYEEDDSPSVTDTAVPAPSLGSAPGVEADLIYRRIAAGDVVVLVSSSLSRLIDRQWAEQNFSRFDADGIVEALYRLATENGVAQAHGCVLELGVSRSSGVDEDYRAPVRPQPVQQVTENGGVSAAPHGPQKPAAPTFVEVLRGPKDWLSRRNRQEAEVQPSAEQGEDDVFSGAFAEAEQAEDDDPEAFSQQPTQRFIQHGLDMPPFRGGQAVETEAAQEESEELDFDGWEDAPPALEDPKFDVPQRMVFRPATVAQSDTEAPDTSVADEEAYWEQQPVVAMPNGRNGHYVPPAPALFTGETGFAFDEEPIAAEPVPARKGRSGGFDVRQTAGTLAARGSDMVRALIPERLGGVKVQGSGGGMLLPLRAVIVGAALLVLVVLAISVMSMSGNSQKTAAASLLQTAQQLEAEANQPGLTDVEKQEKLVLALDKAKEAAGIEASAAEAQLLAEKIQGELDTVQGITRMTSLRPLFDLDEIDKAGNPAAPAAEAGAETTEASAPVSGTTAPNDIIVQSNEAYVLDRTSGRIYRCQIGARTCTVALSRGDTVGDRKVSEIAAMTLRLGSLVAVDDKLVAYAFNSETNAWQAEPLGGTEGLQKPTEIATYDGNLYLLGSKPGQIVKYPAGQYGGAPIDWIQDPGTVQAMKDPVAFAIDGQIYVLLSEGKILVMQGGKSVQTITPKAGVGAAQPTGLFTDTDVRDLYLVRAGDGSLVRLSKEGQSIAVLKAPIDGGLDSVSAYTVNEALGKAYAVQGRKVFEASFKKDTGATAPKSEPAVEKEAQPAAPAGPASSDAQPTAPAGEVKAEQPQVRPTAEP